MGCILVAVSDGMHFLDSNCSYSLATLLIVTAHCRCLLKRARVEKTLTDLFLKSTGDFQATCRKAMVAIMKAVPADVQADVEKAMTAATTSTLSGGSTMTRVVLFSFYPFISHF